jgi:hypothetical protein
MDKLSYLPSHGTVRYTSDFNPAIGNTTKVWGASDFIAAASPLRTWRLTAATTRR